MTEAFYLPPELTPEQKQEVFESFKSRLLNLLNEKYTIVLPENVIDLASRGLTEVFEKYRNYPYHNDEHSWEVIERGLEWLIGLSKRYGNGLTIDDFSVVVVAGAYHDYFLDDMAKEEGVKVTAERQSANFIVDLMGEDFGETLPVRVSNAVMATEVRYENDEVFQTRLAEIDPPDIAVEAIGRADVGLVYKGDTEGLGRDIGNLMAERILRGVKDGRRTIDAILAIPQKQLPFVTQRWLDLDIVERHVAKITDNSKEVGGQIRNGLEETRKELAARAILISERAVEMRDEIERVATDAALSARERAEKFTELLRLP